jgi:hypothetical protein
LLGLIQRIYGIVYEPPPSAAVLTAARSRPVTRELNSDVDGGGNSGKKSSSKRKDGSGGNAAFSGFGGSGSSDDAHATTNNNGVDGGGGVKCTFYPAALRPLRLLAECYARLASISLIDGDVASSVTHSRKALAVLQRGDEDISPRRTAAAPSVSASSSSSSSSSSSARLSRRMSVTHVAHTHAVVSCDADAHESVGNNNIITNNNNTTNANGGAIGVVVGGGGGDDMSGDSGYVFDAQSKNEIFRGAGWRGQPDARMWHRVRLSIAHCLALQVRRAG